MRISVVNVKKRKTFYAVCKPVKYSLFNCKQIIACKNNLLVLYILLFKIDVEIPCLDVEDKFAIHVIIIIILIVSLRHALLELRVK